MNISLSLFVLLLVLSGCHPDNIWEAEAHELIALQSSLQTEHDRLITSVDSLWDVASAMLEKDLPSDIPPVDREIFLHSRNADHIRMFMSFGKLNPALQSLVNRTGEYDKIFAERLRSLSQQQKACDRRKMMFLQKVAQHDTQTYQHYAAKFRSVNGVEEI